MYYTIPTLVTFIAFAVGVRCLDLSDLEGYEPLSAPSGNKYQAEDQADGLAYQPSASLSARSIANDYADESDYNPEFPSHEPTHVPEEDLVDDPSVKARAVHDAYHAKYAAHPGHVVRDVEEDSEPEESYETRYPDDIGFDQDDQDQEEHNARRSVNDVDKLSEEEEDPDSYPSQEYDDEPDQDSQDLEEHHARRSAEEDVPELSEEEEEEEEEEDPASYSYQEYDGDETDQDYEDHKEHHARRSVEDTDQLSEEEDPIPHPFQEYDDNAEDEQFSRRSPEEGVSSEAEVGEDDTTEDDYADEDTTFNQETDDGRAIQAGEADPHHKAEPLTAWLSSSDPSWSKTHPSWRHTHPTVPPTRKPTASTQGRHTIYARAAPSQVKKTGSQWSHIFGGLFNGHRHPRARQA